MWLGILLFFDQGLMSVGNVCDVACCTDLLDRFHCRNNYDGGDEENDTDICRRKYFWYHMFLPRILSRALPWLGLAWHDN